MASLGSVDSGASNPADRAEISPQVSHQDRDTFGFRRSKSHDLNTPPGSVLETTRLQSVEPGQSSSGLLAWTAPADADPTRGGRMDTLRLDSLPNEVLVQVLWYLEVNDLLTVSRVCSDLLQVSIHIYSRQQVGTLARGGAMASILFGWVLL